MANNIDLVYFSKSPLLHQLQISLQQLDYAVNLRPIQGYPINPPLNASLNPIIVFINEPEHLTDPVLRQTFQAVSAVLAVLTSTSVMDVIHDCQDFLLWPCSSEELMARLVRLSRWQQCIAIGDDINDSVQEFARFGLIGRSPVFVDCLRLIKRLARWSVPVLIQGETGTGKELAARALHYLGPRRNKPFIPMNCGALPDTLFVNELFGHERGAFTDARENRKGLIAQAEGGTLFLDEVDSLSPENQTTLLRFLQDQCYRPLGGSQIKQANVTVIAATNADLKQCIQDGTFRQDLLYRLNVTDLVMPCLHQRCGDIALLAQHFVHHFSTHYGQPAKALAPESLIWLERQSWPGNVRELENLIHREFLMADGPVIQIDTGAKSQEQRLNSEPMLNAFSFEEGFNQTRAKILTNFEKRYLDQLMQATHGNVSQAARLTGKERRYLGRLLQKHGINREDYVTWSR